jgi:hypothetical protein
MPLLVHLLHQLGRLLVSGQLVLVLGFISADPREMLLLLLALELEVHFLQLQHQLLSLQLQFLPLRGMHVAGVVADRPDLR